MHNTTLRNLLALGGFSLALGIIHQVLFWDVSIGSNFPLFVFCILLSGGILARIYARKGDPWILYLILPIAFFSIMVSIRASALLTFFNVIGTLLLLLICAGSYIDRPLKDFLPWHYFKIPFLPFRFLIPLREYIFEVVSLRRLTQNHPLLREVIRGTVMAVVALTLFSWLLSSADSIFGKMFETFFNFSIAPDFLPRIILLTIVTTFFIGTFAFMYRSTPKNGGIENTIRSHTLGGVETIILLSSIASLFLLFVIFQIAYLFGGEAHFLAQGITYAEYARKGFFELIAVALLSYVILSYAENQIIKNENSHLKSFKVLSSVLIVEVVLILISAFERLSLYEQSYGFSTIRLYSHALMIWIGCMLLLLAYHIVKSSSRQRFALLSFGSVVIFLCVMNILNPDAFIAQKNIERFKETGVIDTAYLATLSTDALPYEMSLIQSNNKEISQDFMKDFFWNHPIESFENTPWQSYNLSHSRAKGILSSQIEYYKNHPEEIPSHEDTEVMD